MRDAQSAERAEVGRPAARVVHAVDPFCGCTAGGAAVGGPVVGGAVVPGRLVGAPPWGAQAPTVAMSRMAQARRFTREDLRSMTASAARRSELECSARRPPLFRHETVMS